MIPDIATFIATAGLTGQAQVTVRVAIDPGDPTGTLGKQALWTGPRLIGFCGPAGAGKSTAAAHLVAAHGFERHRFAGPLKAMMRALGLTDREVDGDGKERPCALLCGRTPRQAMQWLGTEWGREMIGGALWIEAWARQCDAAFARARPVVVDDVRFADEATAIRARGGLVVRIDRPGAGSATGSGHASEALAFMADETISNAGALTDLATAVEALMLF